MNDLDTVLHQHVKSTANELPADGQRVLLWHSHYEAWMTARYTDKVWWFNDWLFSGYCDDITDHSYWLPLPTFDPSEVQE